MLVCMKRLQKHYNFIGLSKTAAVFFAAGICISGVEYLHTISRYFTTAFSANVSKGKSGAVCLSQQLLNMKSPPVPPLDREDTEG